MSQWTIDDHFRLAMPLSSWTLRLNCEGHRWASQGEPRVGDEQGAKAGVGCFVGKGEWKGWRSLSSSECHRSFGHQIDVPSVLFFGVGGGLCYFFGGEHKGDQLGGYWNCVGEMMASREWVSWCWTGPVLVVQHLTWDVSGERLVQWSVTGVWKTVRNLR